MLFFCNRVQSYDKTINYDFEFVSFILYFVSYKKKRT